MVFKCIKGMFKLERNFRDAFNLEVFVDKYIEECFDKDRYVVGDISSGILRLKGFAPKSEKIKNPFALIDNYLETSCPFGCPYYVVKRIDSEDEYNKLLQNPQPVKTEDKPLITPIEKENFDKESLVLETSKKNRPNIIINPAKMNSIPKGELPADLKEFVNNDNNNSRNDRVQQQKEEPQVEISTYVSASPDFDPSKKESFKKPQNNRGNKNNKPRGNNSNNQSSNGVANTNNGNTNREKPNNNRNRNNKNRNKNNKKPQE